MTEFDSADSLPPFDAELWQWKGHAGWHFITLPDTLSDAVRLQALLAPRGWGSVRVHATSAEVSWDSSLFPDSSSGSYILPVKAKVRRALGISAGDRMALELTFRDAALI